jgi:hypothetical protein
VSAGLARKRRTVIALLALPVLALVVAMLWQLQVWRRGSLPGLRLEDPTPELTARYGIELPSSKERGPIVVSQSPESASIGLGDIREGDWFWVAGDPEPGDLTIAKLKERLLAAHGSLRVVYVYRDHRGTSTQQLTLTPWQVHLYCRGLGASAPEKS